MTDKEVQLLKDYLKLKKCTDNIRQYLTSLAGSTPTIGWNAKDFKDEIEAAHKAFSESFKELKDSRSKEKQKGSFTKEEEVPLIEADDSTNNASNSSKDTKNQGQEKYLTSQGGLKSEYNEEEDIEIFVLDDGEPSNNASKNREQKEYFSTLDFMEYSISKLYATTKYNKRNDTSEENEEEISPIEADDPTKSTSNDSLTTSNDSGNQDANKHTIRNLEHIQANIAFTAATKFAIESLNISNFEEMMAQINSLNWGNMDSKTQTSLRLTKQYIDYLRNFNQNVNDIISYVGEDKEKKGS